MKDDAFFARLTEAEDPQREDRREHDRHEEVGQEDADHRDPAQLQENHETEGNSPPP